MSVVMLATDTVGRHCVSQTEVREPYTRFNFMNFIDKNIEQVRIA